LVTLMLGPIGLAMYLLLRFSLRGNPWLYEDRVIKQDGLKA
jgi:hypothetical protein